MNTVTELNWPKFALCHPQNGYDPETWHPVGKEGPALDAIKYAKDLCKNYCGVVAFCREYALAHPKDAAHGIWGGTDEEDRKAEHKRRKAAQESATVAV